MDRQEATISLTWRTVVDMDKDEEIGITMNDLAADIGQLAIELDAEGVMMESRMLLSIEFAPHPEDDHIPRDPKDLMERMNQEGVDIEVLEGEDFNMLKGKSFDVLKKEIQEDPNITVDAIEKLDDIETFEELHHMNLERLEEFTKRQRVKAESPLLETDEYQRGFYNACEQILAGMKLRRPKLRMPNGTYQWGTRWDGEFD